MLGALFHILGGGFVFLKDILMGASGFHSEGVAKSARFLVNSGFSQPRLVLFLVLVVAEQVGDALRGVHT